MPGVEAAPPSRDQIVARRWTWATVLFGLADILVYVGFCLSLISTGTSASANTGEAYGALAGVFFLVLMTPLYLLIGFAFRNVNRNSERAVNLAMTAATLLCLPWLMRADLKSLLGAVVNLGAPGV